MKLRTTFYSILFLFASINLSGQDLHFSNYTYSPLFFNPANTGAFEGTYRVGASYRSQFFTFFDNPYVSTLAYVDSPVSFALNENGWIGAGLMIYQDQVGDLGIGHTGVMGNTALHYALDDDYEQVISIGAQFGMINYKSKIKLFDPGSGLGRNDFDFSFVDEDNFKPSYIDASVGIRYQQTLSKTNSFIAGASFQHLTSPSYNFSSSSVMNSIGSRINVHGQYITSPSDRVTWKPTVYFSMTEGFTNTILQVLGEYQVNKKSETRLNYGLGYRVGDAAIMTMGFIYKGWNFAFNYDLTLSSASQYDNYTGGIELGVFKTFVVNKKPKKIKKGDQEFLPNLKMLCPRL